MSTFIDDAILDIGTRRWNDTLQGNSYSGESNFQPTQFMLPAVENVSATFPLE